MEVVILAISFHLGPNIRREVLGKAAIVDPIFLNSGRPFFMYRCHFQLNFVKCGWIMHAKIECVREAILMGNHHF